MYKEFLEIVGNGKPTGNVLKGNICSFRHDMNKRGKSSPFKSVSEFFHVKVRVVECRDGLARITLEELAITHLVKNGTLQNACSTRPRVVVGLGRSAHSPHRQVGEQAHKKV